MLNAPNMGGTIRLSLPLASVRECEPAPLWPVACVLPVHSPVPAQTGSLRPFPAAPSSRTSAGEASPGSSLGGRLRRGQALCSVFGRLDPGAASSHPSTSDVRSRSSPAMPGFFYFPSGCFSVSTWWFSLGRLWDRFELFRFTTRFDPVGRCSGHALPCRDAATPAREDLPSPSLLNLRRTASDVVRDGHSVLRGPVPHDLHFLAARASIPCTADLPDFALR